MLPWPWRRQGIHAKRALKKTGYALTPPPESPSTLGALLLKAHSNSVMRWVIELHKATTLILFEDRQHGRLSGMCAILLISIDMALSHTFYFFHLFVSFMLAAEGGRAQKMRPRLPQIECTIFSALRLTHSPKGAAKHTHLSKSTINTTH
jgi:arginine/ornithine N-succinyltransferase beta subunit